MKYSQTWVNDHLRIVILSTAGVTNSNLSEGHIPKKKCSVGRSLLETSFCGPQFARKTLKRSFLSFGMFVGRTNASGGPHAAARVFETSGLQRLFYGPNFNFYNAKLPLNNDHLPTTATNFWSRGWSLYTGLTVLTCTVPRSCSFRSSFSSLFLISSLRVLSTKYYCNNECLVQSCSLSVAKCNSQSV